MAKKYEYDAFISHAVEDKLPIANELCSRLEAAGLRVWYSSYKLNAGDSIEDTVHDGLDKSRYGIVIFTKNYIDKTWTLREYYHLLAREKNEDYKVILPVLYQITPAELAVKDLTMADRFAINTEKGLDYVVQRLLDATKGTETLTVYKNKKRNFILSTILLAVVSGITAPYLFHDHTSSKPEKSFITQAINKRIETITAKAKSIKIHGLMPSPALLSPLSKLDSIYIAYQNQKSHYRNEYEFSDGTHSVSAKKNVDAVLKINAAALNPANAYGMKQPQCYLITKEAIAKYALLNTQPVQTSALDEKLANDSTYSVTATYTNNIRYIEVELLFNNSNNGLKRHHMTLIGLLPEETYLFKKRKGQWVLASFQ